MNNNFYIFVIGACVFALGFSHPAYRKEFDRIVNSNDCLKSCMSNLTNFEEEISLMKNPNLQRYFGKLDGICALISSTRECIDACGIQSNPFALESLNSACSPESREKIAKIGGCLAEKKLDLYQQCSGFCGDYNAVFEEAHQLTQKISEDDVKIPEKVNPIMEKTNQACGIYKCQIQCHVDYAKNECQSDQLQEILQQVYDAQFRDIQKLNLVETMPKTVPQECNYMYDQSVIFAAQTSENSQDMLPKLQLELLQKQLKLADRQEELMNRENQKLDLEMDLLSQKMERKQRPQNFGSLI